MSYRMCYSCKIVVNNRVNNSDHCPICEKSDWANPLENNNEWAIMFDLQKKIDVLKIKVEKLKECVEFIRDYDSTSPDLIKEFKSKAVQCLKEIGEINERV